MRFELAYQILHAIMGFCPDYGSYLWSQLREDFLDRLIHDKLTINETAQQFEGVAFPIQRVNDNYMLFGRIKSNPIGTAPAMDARAANVHMTFDQ
jgi:hypothetical protein